MPEIVSLIDFKYTIEEKGGVIFIKDARTSQIINQYYKVKPELNITEELVRVVFFAPKQPTVLDFKELKRGILKFENYQNKDSFQIKFTNSEGENILNQVVTSFMGQDQFTIETIADYFFQ
ncbi:hypothetical protein KBJ98_02110 [Flavobacterium sp. F-328]|uniref:Uncharacterized protein n=1 Tax=Flavobacterium erciyesense TaxID=2825842 RepID=A0ABS5D0D9_9FLAO|nr:hypothetical protein [Flavobacterium erciyesense]MBQ0907490.1 hypothetical protein [Flavobacterium erciyesense]